MKSSHPVPRQSLLSTLVPAAEDRALARRYSQIQRGAFIERAHDAAERELRRERMSDIGDLTRHGLAEGTQIAEDLQRRVAHNTLAACLAEIAEEGVEGIRDELRSYKRAGR